MRPGELLLRLRGWLVFLVALSLALVLTLYLDAWEARQGLLQRPQLLEISDTRLLERARSQEPRPLTDSERAYAETAWRYFQTYSDPVTGLAYSVSDYPSTTLWEVGGQLLALVSAEGLELIAREDARQRLSLLLTSLEQLELFQGLLPNKAYNAQTLAMTDYQNREDRAGLGWSALDVMRALIGLRAVARHFPELAGQVVRVEQRWHLEEVLHEGSFQGGHRQDNGKVVRLAEGRLGYEQYAARGALLMGMDASAAFRVLGKLRSVEVLDLALPADRRTRQSHGVPSVITSEPFVLEALEFGWRSEMLELATQVYAVQERRFEQSGVLTALSEDHLSRAPFFAYNGVLVDDQPFVTISANNQVLNNQRSVSAKAAVAWHALMRTPYSQRLFDAVATLQGPTGFEAGIYEADGSVNQAVALNTNAVILEALHYMAKGPLL
jgi:hypothetical protein